MFDQSGMKDDFVEFETLDKDDNEDILKIDSFRNF